MQLRVGAEFATIEAALAKARTLPGPRNVTILVGGAGPTIVTSTVNLTSADSCVTLAGCFGDKEGDCGAGDSGDHVSGAVRILPAALVVVSNHSNPEAYSRLAPEARGHVYQLDIANLSNTNLWPDTFTVGDTSTRNFALYYNNTRLRRARWPKARQNLTAQYPTVPADKQYLMSRSGGVPMKAALAGTSKAWVQGDHKTPGVFAVYKQTVAQLSRFASAVEHGLWLEGNWRVDFVESGVRVAALSLDDPANATVELSTAPTGGLGWKYDKSSSGCGCEPFHVINALEAITEEGEFALDFLDRKAYIYLPSSPRDAAAGNATEVDKSLVTLADNAGPVLRVGEGVNDVRIKNLRVGFSLGDAIEISGAAGNVEVAGSVLHNIDGNGVSVYASNSSSTSRSSIRSNDIFATGDGGVFISGGY